MPCILLVLISLLIGCVGPDQYAVNERERVRQECLDIASAYEFTGAVHRQYMGLCQSITGGSGRSISTPVFYGQQTTMGQPDAFGPYGVWGPTWQSFNGAFQEPPPRR